MLTNTLKTTVLLGGLGGLIVLVAGLLGGGSTTALVIGLLLALVVVGGSYWFSGTLALKSAHATVISEEDSPEFFGVVRSLAERAGLPMPQVAISPSEQPNAFATGRNPHHAVVCATVGLLRQMPRDELEGVMAHELMHVKHRDILIGSVAAAIATAISFLANMALWSGILGGGDDDDRPNPIVLIAASVLAPLAAGILQMAISRSREFDADRGAAELLHTGRPLASALQRIDGIAHQIPMQVNPGQAAAWIHNPLEEAPKRRGGPDLSRLFSTHPSTEERIARLMAMTPAA
jgi:heat shock protein HtpX